MSYQWNEPPAPYSGSRSAPPVSPAQTGWGWRIRHSAWILAPVLGFGLLSFVGFAYCAARVRELRWFVLAAVALLAALLGWYLTAVWVTPAGDLTAGATCYVLGLWGASVAFALLVAPDYLRWRAGPTDARQAR